MDHRLPEWAPRVPRALIDELYTNDALGMPDEELLDDVGWRLRARCLGFIQAVGAANGSVTCPACESTIPHQHQPEEILRCTKCGWELPWMAYFKTFQHKQLSGAQPILATFQEYVQRFPLARTAEEKVLHIDHLLHAFHINMLTNRPTRAAAVNLIEGNYHEVVDFLDRLSYAPKSTSGLLESRREWRSTINRTAAEWNDESLRRPEE